MGGLQAVSVDKAKVERGGRRKSGVESFVAIICIWLPTIIVTAHASTPSTWKGSKEEAKAKLWRSLGSTGYSKREESTTCTIRSTHARTRHRNYYYHPFAATTSLTLCTILFFISFLFFLFSSTRLRLFLPARIAMPLHTLVASKSIHPCKFFTALLAVAVRPVL